MEAVDPVLALAIVVSIAALALGLRVATEGRRSAALRSDLEEVRRGEKGSRKQREQRDKALRDAESRAGKADRKLAQAEKRVAQAKEGGRAERTQLGERIAALEQETLAARTTNEGLEADLDTARRQLERATDQFVEADARAEARAESEAAATERAEALRDAALDPAEFDALGERVSRAEAEAAEHRSALAAASARVERLKSRAETQDQLYASIRSELAIKKEQIRQQREEIERLQATKVAWAGPVEADPDEETDPGGETTS
jgi:chromosome segregation ATPase